MDMDSQSNYCKHTHLSLPQCLPQGLPQPQYHLPHLPRQYHLPHLPLQYHLPHLPLPTAFPPPTFAQGNLLPPPPPPYIPPPYIPPIHPPPIPLIIYHNSYEPFQTPVPFEAPFEAPGHGGHGNSSPSQKHKLSGMEFPTPSLHLIGPGPSKGELKFFQADRVNSHLSVQCPPLETKRKRNTKEWNKETKRNRQEAKIEKRYYPLPGQKEKAKKKAKVKKKLRNKKKRAARAQARAQAGEEMVLLHSEPSRILTRFSGEELPKETRVVRLKQPQNVHLKKIRTV